MGFYESIGMSNGHTLADLGEQSAAQARELGFSDGDELVFFDVEKLDEVLLFATGRDAFDPMDKALHKIRAWMAKSAICLETAESQQVAVYGPSAQAKVIGLLDRRIATIGDGVRRRASAVGSVLSVVDSEGEPSGAGAFEMREALNCAAAFAEELTNGDGMERLGLEDFVGALGCADAVAATAEALRRLTWAKLRSAKLLCAAIEGRASLSNGEEAAVLFELLSSDSDERIAEALDELLVRTESLGNPQEGRPYRASNISETIMQCSTTGKCVADWLASVMTEQESSRRVQDPWPGLEDLDDRAFGVASAFRKSVNGRPDSGMMVGTHEAELAHGKAPIPDAFEKSETVYAYMDDMDDGNSRQGLCCWSKTSYYKLVADILFDSGSVPSTLAEAKRLQVADGLIDLNEAAEEAGFEEGEALAVVGVGDHFMIWRLADWNEETASFQDDLDDLLGL